MELLALDVCVARCALWGPSFVLDGLVLDECCSVCSVGPEFVLDVLVLDILVLEVLVRCIVLDLLVLMVFGLLVIETYAMLVTLGCDVTVHSPWWQTPLPTV